MADLIVTSIADQKLLFLVVYPTLIANISGISHKVEITRFPYLCFWSHVYSFEDSLLISLLKPKNLFILRLTQWANIGDIAPLLQTLKAENMLAGIRPRDLLCMLDADRTLLF